jgi:hypothetical protein
MSDTTPVGQPPAPKAEHGARSEVNWDDGQGSEPYANQDAEEAAASHAGEEVSEGDRGAASGRNLDQLEAVKGKPGVMP